MNIFDVSDIQDWTALTNSNNLQPGIHDGVEPTAKKEHFDGLLKYTFHTLKIHLQKHWFSYYT